MHPGHSTFRREGFSTFLLRTLTFNLVLSVVIHAAFVWLSGGLTLPSAAYLPWAVLSNSAMLLLPLAAILTVLYHLIVNAALFHLCATVACAALPILLVFDLAVYRFFRFHLNGMVLNILTTEGAWDSVSVGFHDLAVFLGVSALIVAAEWVAVRGPRRRLRGTGAETRGVPRHRGLAIAAIAVIAVIVVDKSIYAASDVYDRGDILQVGRALPLYQPFTVKRFLRDRLGYAPAGTPPSPLEDPSTRGFLRYPLTPLVRDAGVRLPNVLLLVIDSWRSDMLDHETTPRIAAHSRSGRVFASHFTGGNGTRHGVFTLLYGLYGTYWDSVLAERRSPVLVDELLRLGYDFHVLSSTQLSFPEFRKTAFVRVADSIEDKVGGFGAAERDPRLVARLLDRLDGALARGDRKPFFAFLFFDAPHGPYSYPPAEGVFLPARPRADYLGKVDPAVAGELRNAYRNAVRFDDRLVGELLDGLDRRGILADTLLIVTGDHGEEILEHGHLGHSSAYSAEQVRVPLVISGPGVAPGREDFLSSGVDVVPTILTLLGYTTDPAAYSSGRPLTDRSGRDAVYVSNWDTGAVIDRECTIVFSTGAYNPSRLEARATADYSLLADARAARQARVGLLARTAAAMGVFYR